MGPNHARSVGFYQIAIKIESVYEIFLPAEVRTLLHQLSIAISFGIEAVPLACVGANGYLKRLQFWMWTPLVICAIATLVVSGLLLCKRHREDKDDATVMSTFFRQVMAVLLRVAFLAYPIVVHALTGSNCERYRRE